MNDFEDKCHEVCKSVLKKHYNQFRKDIKDGFFYNTPVQGQRRLTEMLGNFRKEIDEVVRFGRHDNDSEVIKETIMGEYMQIGRKYGERVLKKAGL
ncbi:MAG: hypothetical protein ACTHOM_04835 [Allomuricauda sp.]